MIQPDGACGLISLLAAGRFSACCPMDPALTVTELDEDLRQLGAAAIVVEDRDGLATDVASKLGLAVIRAEPAIPLCRWQLVRSLGEAKRRSNDGATLLLHTSATTGRSKLVPSTDANVSAVLEHTFAVTRITANDRLLLTARHFHIQGAVAVLAQLLVGGSVIAPGHLVPGALCAALQTFGPTWYTCGPTMHRALLTQIKGRRDVVVPSSLRFVRCGGAPLTTNLYDELRATLQVPVLNMYGLSETGGIASTTLEGASPPGSVGRSIGPEIAVMRADGTLLDAEQEGEIVVRGPAVMHGYLHQENANRKAFRAGWFRTGDLGRIDRNGFLFLSGRIKEIINRGGEKVIPDEVDAVLSQHPDVHEVAAFGVPHPTLGEDVACAIVLREGATVEAAELRSFASRQLAAFKLPRHIFFRDAIPRGSTGKPKRLTLRDEYASFASGEKTAERHTDLPTALPEDTRLIMRLWCSLLGRGKVGLNDDFFALGGDSLAAVTMLAAVDDLFGLAIPLSAERFLMNSTIAGLMEMLRHAGDAAGEQRNGIVYPMRTSGAEGATLFLLPAGETNGLTCADWRGT